MNIYLAGPIFSEADRMWLGQLKGQILDSIYSGDAAINVIWAFENTHKRREEKLPDDIMRNEILRICIDGLNRAHLMIAVLDGTQVDDGTAWEIGYFFARNGSESKIIGIRTDFRNCGDIKSLAVNSLVAASCVTIVGSVDELLQEIDCVVGGHSR